MKIDSKLDFEFDFYGYLTIQVDLDLYALRNHFDETEWIRYSNLDCVKITKTELVAPEIARLGASVTNFKNKLVVVAGGTNEIGSDYATVEIYSLVDEKWTKAPKLNERRCNHSSCTLGDSVYLFGCTGGISSSAIEWLDFEAHLRGHYQPHWNIIRPDADLLKARVSSLFCPVNSTQILIMGGSNKSKLLEDAFVFDTSDESVTPLDCWGPG